MSTIDQIERLQKLLSEGAITQDEFRELKRQVIAGEALDHPATNDVLKPDAPVKGPVVANSHAGQVSAADPETEKPHEKPHKVYGQTDFVPPARTNVVKTETTTATVDKTGDNTAKTLGIVALVALIGMLGWYFFLKPTEAIPPATASAGDTSGVPYNITSQAGSNMEDPFELNDLQVEEANSTTFKTYRGENISEPIAYPTDIVKPKEPVVTTASAKTTETTTKKKGSASDTAAQTATSTSTTRKSQEFSSPGGDVSMFIHEEDGKGTLAGKYREELNTVGGNKSVTYKLLKDDFFVVSGYKGDNVYYQKTVMKDGKFKTFYTEYPKSKKEQMDPVTVRMSRSFK